MLACRAAVSQPQGPGTEALKANQFSRVTKPPVQGCEQRMLLWHSSGGWESRQQQGWFPQKHLSLACGRLPSPHGFPLVCMCVRSCFSRVRLPATPRTV